MTTKSEFNLFKAECLKWIKFFGLTDWRIVFVHEHLKDHYCYAELRVQGIEDRVASFAFNKECSTEDREDFDIKRVAFHEVWELILHPLEYIGSCRYIHPEELTQARHAIIRMMENTVYRELSRVNP